MTTLVDQLSSSRTNSRIQGSITPAMGNPAALETLDYGDRISQFEILRAQQAAQMQEEERRIEEALLQAVQSGQTN